MYTVCRMQERKRTYWYTHASLPAMQTACYDVVIEQAHLCIQASARRSSEDGFGSVVGARSRRQSHSPLSPATGGPGTSARPSQAQTHGPQDVKRPEGSRRGHSDSPSSPTLQPNTTPRMAQTPTLGTGKTSHILITSDTLHSRFCTLHGVCQLSCTASCPGLLSLQHLPMT